MRPIVRLLAGLGIAAAMLALYHNRAYTEHFNSSPSNQGRIEKWNGEPFTAASVPGIKRLISQRTVTVSRSSDCDGAVILWLGNSQLHFINQVRAGDHLAPYWLRKALDCEVPLGMSLPNANLQELYVLASAAISRLPTKLILLELCFDDLREDGLRAEFSSFFDPAVRTRIVGNPVGNEIVTRGEAGWNKADTADESSGLRGFAQKSVEDRLNDALGGAWPFWEDRSNLRVQVLMDLYFARNALLGIKPTTVRKMIAPRYARNMIALRQLLQEAQRDGITVVAYIAPIRQDISSPYDQDAYQRWKSAIKAIASQHGATLVNLEALVPPEHWGETFNSDVDFMHFKGEGHELLARALQPYVERLR